jgi:hypothetical protein
MNEKDSEESGKLRQKIAIAVEDKSAGIVWDQILELDNKAELDAEGNPQRLWVKTNITTAELLKLPNVLSAVVANERPIDYSTGSSASAPINNPEPRPRWGFKK